ncbi:PqiC family protein [Methylomonas sp. AM2-LC]|uniref:PqiC family protein n=1 Tax=Methylomonas sp. AM2-LC TaxID=3153301 RepID=UPI0032641FA3
MENKLFLTLYKHNNRLRIVALSSLMLSACSSHSPVEFYMLNAETSVDTPSPSVAFNSKLLIGIGPIHVPEYLNRPQMVIAKSENQYVLDEQHRWAENLTENINRSIAQFLAKRLGVEQILRYPWSQRQQIDYQVSVDIFQFHQNADQHSQLNAQWQIKHQEQTLLTHNFSCDVAAQSQPEAIVAAQSTCLSNLGLEIEAGLRQLAQMK